VIGSISLGANKSDFFMPELDGYLEQFVAIGSVLRPDKAGLHCMFSRAEAGGIEIADKNMGSNPYLQASVRT
jgi:hypothetical protein